MNTEYALTPPVFTQKFLGKVAYELGVLIGSPEKTVDQVSFKDYDENGKQNKWAGVLVVKSRPESKRPIQIRLEVKESTELYLEIQTAKINIVATLPIPIQAEVRNPESANTYFMQSSKSAAKSLLLAVNEKDGLEIFLNDWLSATRGHPGLFTRNTNKEENHD